MTVVLLRHADRHQSGSDGLSPAGEKRATLLVRMFREAGVSAIFTSEFKRTKDTAAPLAQALAVSAQPIASHPNAARTQVLNAGPLALVVGHSDTVPALIAALGGPSGIEIKELEFDRMFVLTIGQGPVSLLTFRYVSE